MSTVSNLITRKPLLPVITLKKNDATLYTYNPFTSTFDFRVRRLQVSPPYSNTAGIFTLELTSANGSNVDANTLISNVDEGNEVTIWIGKSDASKTKIFTGIIESWVINEENKNFMNLSISGPDFGSDVLKNRVVNGKWGQQIDSAGDTVVADITTSIYQVVTDMLTKGTFYPDQANIVTAEDQGIVVTSTNIKGEDLQLKSFSANYEFLGDKIQALDEIGGTIHWVDPDKSFHMDYPTTVTSTSSGVLLTDDNTDATALAWLPVTKLGLIAPGSTLIRTLENHKRRIWGMGGVNVAIDTSSTTDAGTPTTLEGYNYAMKFVPTYSTVSKIILYLSRVGTPTEDFIMELREDFNGLPTGKVLRTLSKPKAFLNADTLVHASPFEINEDVIIGFSYWIVVRKNGSSASHTFRWHHDNVNHATSYAARSITDGSPTPDWALLTSNKFYYAYIQYKGDEVFNIISQTPISATTKHLHDDIIRKDDITDSEVMQKLLIAETSTLFKRKEIFKAEIYSPDTLLTAGQKLRIRKQASGYTFDAEFVLGSVDYIFESTDDQATGSFYYFIEAIRFVDIS